MGDLLACCLPHGFLAFLLGIGALRNTKTARNFCLVEAEVFAPGADGCHVFVDDFFDHGVGKCEGVHLVEVSRRQRKRLDARPLALGGKPQFIIIL